MVVCVLCVRFFVCDWLFVNLCLLLFLLVMLLLRVGVGVRVWSSVWVVGVFVCVFAIVRVLVYLCGGGCCVVVAVCRC